VASRSADKVVAAVSLLKDAGAKKARGFSADVRDADALQAGITEIHRDWGDLDVVVSGAAGNFPATAAGMSANAFKAVVDIDLLGTFHVMKAIYPCLKKPGAAVINISAPQAFVPMAAQAHVCAAKAGVDMVTRCLAIEWGAEGVRVNSIVPGPIDGTEGMARLAPTETARRTVIASVPLKRLGSPEDIARMCLFLGSDWADYVSGAVIPVDGGWSQSGAGGMSDFLAQAAQIKRQ
jgi:NAD(P)-dependent dehydrogenase (short-subunit alcohol dehydrogenase family)